MPMCLLIESSALPCRPKNVQSCSWKPDQQDLKQTEREGKPDPSCGSIVRLATLSLSADIPSQSQAFAETHQVDLILAHEDRTVRR